MIRFRAQVRGIVQGVGFRPFLYREAIAHNLSGFVKNTSFGVYLEVEGSLADCEAFFTVLQTTPPPLSRITDVERSEIPVTREQGFSIRQSSSGEKSALVSPDIGICDDCKRELFSANDRRYRYPFINCTNCGPRFSIVNDVPYDRVNTSMAGFVQCPPCQHEYENPLDRRFHAQPNACAVCGPRLSFLVDGVEQKGDPVDLFAAFIRSGKIVAVKGIGGFHLACDATNESAVNQLRARKQRYEKPFALMLRSLDEVERYCIVSDEERALLTSPQKPIVLLQTHSEALLAPSVAPGNRRLGVMLPYTPLHCLLLEATPALVLTSGNISDCPMLYHDNAIPSALASLADAILTHNRPIVRRVDDSVFIVSLGSARPLRRARGWAPEPLPLKGGARPILAMGAQQKNTFCLVRKEQAFLSSHVGDLDDPETEAEYLREIASMQRLFSIQPEMVVCDLHPDYVSTRLAHKSGLPLLAVQHHHAHFASVLAEHDVDSPALGFIWDGTGYGTDGTIWGGETLFGNVAQSERIGHILPFRLFGGESAVREPWRIALSVAEIALGRAEALSLFPSRAAEARLLLQASDAGLNAPQTTSMGRLFDAVAAICNLRETVSFEGQAAILLEQIADASEQETYRFDLKHEQDGWIYDWRPVIKHAILDAAKGVPAEKISMRFHRSLAKLLLDTAAEHRRETGCSTIALSGGCFQNELLLSLCHSELTQAGFSVLINRLVPCNDGGISYGQAAVAAALQTK
ncbi:MAG TPA: carbamoyltransferase HypF [Clostridia bacterium]|nr:carbamoyltransferase HypF [Clostridia bacterium]